MLGASGNVARNVAALGGEVSLVGVIGGDLEGNEAQRLVGEEAGVEGYLVTDAERSDHAQDPVRVRRPAAAAGRSRSPPGRWRARSSSAWCAPSATRPRTPAPSCFPTMARASSPEAVIAVCREAAAESGGKLVVDSKARSFARYGAVDMIKPNAAELARATDLPTETDDQVAAALDRALELCEAKAILVTPRFQGHFAGRARRARAAFPDGAPGGVRRFRRRRHHARGAWTGLGGRGRHRRRPWPSPSSPPASRWARWGRPRSRRDELIEAALSAHMAPAEARGRHRSADGRGGRPLARQGTEGGLHQRLLRHPAQGPRGLSRPGARLVRPADRRAELRRERAGPEGRGAGPSTTWNPAPWFWRAWVPVDLVVGRSRRTRRSS